MFTVFCHFHFESNTTSLTLTAPTLKCYMYPIFIQLWLFFGMCLGNTKSMLSVYNIDYKHCEETLSVSKFKAMIQRQIFKALIVEIPYNTPALGITEL